MAEWRAASILALGFVMMAAGGCADGSWGSITVGPDQEIPQCPRIVLGNSVFHAVIRPYLMDKHKVEQSIQVWTLKRANVQQAGAGKHRYIDASAHRGPILKAEVTYDGPDRKTVRTWWRQKMGDRVSVIEDYTIYRDSPVIRLDYIRYGEGYGGWFNTVDIGAPGGLGDRHQARTILAGMDAYRPELVYHEESYWNIHDEGFEDHPRDGGPLNVNGQIVMAVVNEKTGAGFGRVMPIWQDDGDRGGVRAVKLLWDQGFETFPGAGGSDPARPVTGYLYCFDGGAQQALEMGRAIANGDMLIGGSPANR